MKTPKLFLLALFLGLGTLLSAQTVYISGTVTEQGTNNPIANQTVYITFDSTFTFSYNTTVQTNANGFYVDTVALPPAITQGTFWVWTYDCNLGRPTLTRGFHPGNYNHPNLDFNICTSPTPSCQAQFSSQPVLGTTTWNFQDQTVSTGQVVSWAWDFGDGNSSSAASPSHSYNATGTYLVCLTIFTSDSCSSMYCDSVQVGSTGSSCQADFSYQLVNGVHNFVSSSTASAGIASYYWNFGDGNSSFSANPQHTFAAAGTYNVCLSIIAQDSCMDTYCSTVTVQGSGNGPFILAGQVLQANPGNNIPFTEAKVYLIEYDSLNQTLTAIDTTLVDSMGGFRFVANGGSYRIKAALTPASAQYASYLPTYHTSSLFWYNADVINLNSNIFNAHVNMVAGNNPGGPGFVGGSVLQGANKTAGPGDPLEGIQVMVLNLNDSPVQYTYTDANGEYDFSNLAYGTYKVYVEVLGKSTTPEIVTIDGQTPGFNNVNFLVNSTEVVTSTRPAPLQADIKVFPVPAQDWLHLDARLEQATDLNIRLLSLDGRVLKEMSAELNSGQHLLKMDVSQLPAGIYFLKVAGDEGQYLKKVLIH